MSRRPGPGGSVPRLVWECLAVGLRAAPLASTAQMVLTLTVGLLPAAAAWCAKLLLDELTGEAAAQKVVVLAVAGAAAVALASAGGHWLAALADYTRLATSALLQARLYDKVNSLIGLRHFDDPSYHERLTFAQNGARQAPGELTGFATSVVSGTAGAAGYVVVLVHLWPPLVVLIFLLAAVTLGGQAWLIGLQAEAAQRISASERRRTMFQLMLLNPRAAKEIRLYGLGGFFHERMMAAIRAGAAVDIGMARRNAWIRTIFGLAAGAIATIGTVVVARRVSTGQATVGDVAFLAAAVAGLQSGLTEMISTFGQAGLAVRQFGWYRAVHSQPDELAAGTRATPPLRHGIELRDVWFRYSDNSPWILRGVCLRIPHGKAVGVVGLNGAGKSTLIKLLCRFYDPQRGSITWDGIDLREFDPSLLRQRIGATYQDFMTFDLNARDSIGIGDLARLESLPQIRDAARGAEVDAALEALPRGYQTMLSSFLPDEAEQDSGVLLSGGQWQRVALARAMMRRDAELLILDEPSSGLDAVAEHRIHTTLAQMRRGRTTVLISHRLGALRDADLIVVLAEGVVAECGSHQDLMTAQGLYAELFLLQAAGYDNAIGAPS